MNSGERHRTTFLVVLGLARIDQVQTVAVRQPMLLGG